MENDLGLTELADNINNAHVEQTTDIAPPPIKPADQNNFAGVYDDQGTAFDPAIHAVKNDGTPSITKTGKFRKKTRRGNSTQNPHNLNLPGQDNFTARDMGYFAAGAFINTGMILFGDEWEPENNAERQALEVAFYDWLDANGLDDLPPGLALAVACGSYALKRTTKPKTATKISYFFGWIKGKFSRVKTHASRTDRRAERMRQNDNSKTDNRWFSRFRGASAGA